MKEGESVKQPWRRGQREDMTAKRYYGKNGKEDTTRQSQ